MNNLESKKQSLRIMKSLVEESLSVLTGQNDITEFGELLHEAWMAKRSLSSLVSNPQVDAIYDSARAV